MKKLFVTILTILVAVNMSAQFNKSSMERDRVIRLSTESTDWILEVAKDSRLYQLYLGERLLGDEDIAMLQRPSYFSGNGTLEKRSREVLGCSGNEDYYEPALGFVHADGNRTTYLYVKDVQQKSIPGGTEVAVTLQDDKYPVKAVLHIQAFEKENVFKVWNEVSHDEDGTVVMNRFYSAALYFDAPEYYLNEFSSDWAKEVRQASQQLQFGKKIVDTKLGSRANLLCQPFFEVGIGQPVQESQGQVLLGTIGWPGNWRYTLEVDNTGGLCVLAGINPFASEYRLKAGEVFTTPEFTFSLSQNGLGEGSRGFHDWAREYQVKNGKTGRLSLLNNWENTGFDFDEEKLAACMREAKDLGVDLFLLDDGWFGNGKDARNDDSAGLGDWEVNHKKLPHGVPGLVKAATEAGVKFGIWIEPEMVNPQSKLMRKHPEWVIQTKNRENYVYRNQLVLDLSNPEVQDYVFQVVENIMKENPQMAFFKWDCNSPITNIYSSYEGENQGQMYIDHTRGVVNVMRRVAEAYPDVPMMLCSGGGGRGDYEALKYFTEFWPSDNTNPVERAYIQWGFSQFFPAKTMCAHVTSWNRSTSVKFRTDMASMCKLGFDIGLKDMSEDELQYCREAIANWKRLSPAIMDGDQYRLVSPYETNHMAVNYVSKDRKSAVLFAYDIHPRFGEKLPVARIQGLDPKGRYLVKEINIMPGEQSWMSCDGKVYSGDYLSKVGLDIFTTDQTESRVFELILQ